MKDTYRLRAQLSVLKDISENYGMNRSIGNVIQNIETILKVREHETH